MQTQLVSTDEGTAMTKPLSLQYLTFLHLAAHLDRYPPDSLALLPCRLRQELLSQLTPVDILQLELTSVCEGLDMNEVWKNVCQRHDLKSYASTIFSGVSPAVYLTTLLNIARTLSARKTENSPVDWREFFVTVACNLLLCAQQLPLAQYSEPSCNVTEQHSIYVILLQYLFCNQFWRAKRYTLEGDGISMFVYGQRVRPSRFARYTSITQVSFTLTDLVAFVTDVCRVYPKSLVVDCDLCSIEQFYSLPMGEKLLQDFLSQVRDVHFVSRSMNLGSTITVTQLLRVILSTPSPELCSLSICLEEEQRAVERGSLVRADTSLRNILLAIRPFFAAFQEDSSSEGFPCSSASTGMKSLVNGPCLSLRSLRVSKKGRHSGTSGLCAKYFFDIVQAQQKLETVEISGWWTWSDRLTPPVNISSVSSLFFHSQLSLIQLRQLDLPAFVVQSLVEAFVQSPSTHKQEFTLYSVWMYGDCRGRTTTVDNHLNLPKKDPVTEQKYLTLQSMYIPNSFIEWLTTLECINLNTLVVCDVQYDRDMYPGGIIGALGRHKHCQVRTVHLSTHTHYCPSEGLELLLQSPSLKELCLTGPKHELFDNLLTGLQNQAAVGSLRTLAIFQTSFVEMDSSEFGRLAAAVFSLPQLSELTLEIADCQMVPEQIMSLGSAWRGNRTSNGNRLQRFKLMAVLTRGFPNCEEPAFLHEIGMEVELNIKTPNKH